MSGLPRLRTTKGCLSLDGRLASYMAAAGALGTTIAGEASAVVVGSNTVQPFGINEEVNIDFNSDGQIDFQIDHDRVDVGGAVGEVDYLQLDKNDINGHLNPLDFDPGPDTIFQATTFPAGGTTPNDANEAAYVIDGPQGSYPQALTLGAPIGPNQTFDYQEGGNFQAAGTDIRANRLIDEDATQIDQILGGQPPAGVQVPFNGPNFVGLGGETRYLGVKMDLNNSDQFTYGWIGIRITNEADATGEVTGWAYQTNGGQIAAGVPEPGSLITALVGGAVLVGSFLWRRIVR